MTRSPQHNFGTPAPNWADGSSRRKDNTVWVPAMLVGALIFAVGCGSGLLVGWFAGTVNSIGDAFSDFGPANITIAHDAPGTAVVGEPVVVTLTISDTSGSQRLIRDIDWSGTIVDNMELGIVTPAPQSDTPDASYHEFVFDQQLGANQSTGFSFKITPNQAGIYHAEITVYIDEYNSQSTQITIEATAPESED